MTNEEQVKLIQKGIDVTANMEQLYINNKGYIHKIAMKYAGYADIEDLMQEAYFGLHEAVQRYEDTHETKFMTYAAFWIRQSIARYIENTGKVISIPIKLQHQISQYRKLVDTYRIHLHREPTDQEACFRLGISTGTLNRIKNTIHAFCNLDSLDREISSDSDTLLLSDSVADKTCIEDEIIDRMMTDKQKTELWELVDKNTDVMEYDVLISRFKENMTLDGIGEQYGITREAVRSCEAKALRKLRRSKCISEIMEKFEVNYAKAYRGSVSNFNNTWTSSTEYVAIKNYEINV